MKYCLHDGELFKVTDESDKRYYIQGLYNQGTVEKEKAVLVPEDVFQKHLDLYKEAVETIKNVTKSICELDENYHKTRKPLVETKYAARLKEIQIVSDVLKESKEWSKKNE